MLPIVLTWCFMFSPPGSTFHSKYIPLKLRSDHVSALLRSTNGTPFHMEQNLNSFLCDKWWQIWTYTLFFQNLVKNFDLKESLRLWVIRIKSLQIRVRCDIEKKKNLGWICHVESFDSLVTVSPFLKKRIISSYMLWTYLNRHKEGMKEHIPGY